MSESERARISSQQTEYVETFWRRFVHAFPQWARCSREQEPKRRVLEIPSLNEGGQPAMLIIVDGLKERITIGFGGGHIDLADWHADRGHEAIFSDAIQFIREITDEKWVGVTLTGGGVLADPGKLDSALWAADVVQVVSWKGTLNQERRNTSPSG